MENLKFLAKNKKEYELFKEEFERLLSDKNSMKLDTEKRIDNYKTNTIYSNMKEYRNERILEEEELLKHIEKHLEEYKYMLDNLDYNRNK